MFNDSQNSLMENGMENQKRILIRILKSGKLDAEESAYLASIIKNLDDDHSCTQPIHNNNNINTNVANQNQNQMHQKFTLDAHQHQLIQQKRWQQQFYQQKQQTELQKTLSDLFSWNDFDVFRLDEISHGNALFVVSMELLHSLGLIQALKLPIKKLHSFLIEIQNSYLKNPYHNAQHAADVVQSVGCIIFSEYSNFFSNFTNLQIFALIFSGLIHDVAHPGVTNDFLVKTQSDFALIYNDQSVNENMHLSRSFYILLKPENNFISQWENSDYVYFRKLVVSSVLSTDMFHHRNLVSSIADILNISNMFTSWENTDVNLQEKNEHDFDEKSNNNNILDIKGILSIPENVEKILSLCLHCADLGNLAKKPRFSGTWSLRIAQENLIQGGMEKNVGLKITADFRTYNLGQSQLGFLKCMKPFFQQFQIIAPNLGKLMVQNLEGNILEWRKVLVSNSRVKTIGSCQELDLESFAPQEQHQEAEQESTSQETSWSNFQ